MKQSSPTLHIRSVAISLATTLVALLTPVEAQAVNDPIFPTTVEVGGEPLYKVGSGIYRFARVFKVTAAALYLPAGVSPERALENISKHLEIFYYRDVTAAQFIDMGDSALRKNVTRAEWDRMQSHLAKINALYRDVQAGDSYSLSYHPDTGLILSLNNEELGAIEDPDFAALYYRIWLGEQSVNNRFRDEILGLR